MEFTEENRANLKVFSSFEQEYRQIVNELLSELREREKAVDLLVSKVNINEQRHREYRFSFGNVNLLEDKLKKMEHIYSDKINTVFGHYSRSIGVINQELKKIEYIASRLKEDQISHSKASSKLSESYDFQLTF